MTKTEVIWQRFNFTAKKTWTYYTVHTFDNLENAHYLIIINAFNTKNRYYFGTDLNNTEQYSNVPSSDNEKLSNKFMEFFDITDNNKTKKIMFLATVENQFVTMDVIIFRMLRI